jgi:hypothetical protein
LALCHCKGRKLFKVTEHVGSATSYAIRHLRNKHNIDVKTDEVAIPLQPPSLFGSVTTAATAAVEVVRSAAARLIASTAESTARLSVIVTL